MTEYIINTLVFLFYVIQIKVGRSTNVPQHGLKSFYVWKRPSLKWRQPNFLKLKKSVLWNYVRLTLCLSKKKNMNAKALRVHSVILLLPSRQKTVI